MGLLKRIQYVISGREPDQEPLYDETTDTCNFCLNRGLRGFVFCPICFRSDDLFESDENDPDEVVDLTFTMISGPK